ncbi:hypothetical protein SO802_000343 [Lithocarpus litseifolius]|uniref:RNase H type-1 domain-containing protein n=1 Tax=Lithocarpus litseifolius TaxID=425828 RepID=A0AAW2DT38_9ROSI
MEGKKKLLILNLFQFSVPVRNCDKLDSLSRRFWWKPKEKEGRYIAWKRWNKLCQPRCVGGLGFKNTREVIEALLAKFAWMVASGKQSLCMEVLRSKYKVKEDWLRSEPSKFASPTWRAIERAKKLIEKGACFLLGDGKSINIWADPWVPWTEDFMPKPRIDDYLQLPNKAHHVIDHNFKAWDEDMVKEVFSAKDAQAILSIPIPHHPKQDRLIWLPDSQGTFIFARALWAVVGWGIRIDIAPLTSSENILKLIINPPDAPIPANEQWIVTLNMALIMDEIWNSRNRKLFKQDQTNLINAKRSCSTSWSPPSPNHIKINVDAALNSSKSALAVVARNHLGKALFVWGKVHQLCPPLQAKALALLWAAHLTIQNRWYSVMFEGDSKICFDALNHPNQTPRWSVDTLVSNICSLSSCFSSCKFGWVRKSSNSAAHVAARFALNCMQSFCFSEAMLPLAIEAVCKGETSSCFPS